MYRHLATHLAVLAIGVGAGVGTIAVASQGASQAPTSAAGPGAANGRVVGGDPVVGELRDLNRKLDRLSAMIFRATQAGLPVRPYHPTR